MLTITFKKAKETTNKVMYLEEDTDLVGRLYLRKEEAKALGNPAKIVVKIETES